MMPLTLRPYTPADEDAAIELWRRTWAQHYPHIDFNARVVWWRERWRQELVPVARVVVAEIETPESPHTPLIPVHGSGLQPARAQAPAGIQSPNLGRKNRDPGSPPEPVIGPRFARTRWRGRAGKIIAGFVTVDPKTQYLDQIVVAPEHWGQKIAGQGIAPALLDEAKRLSPDGLYLLVNKDNARAIAFYAKHGFVYDGDDKNPVSGIAVNRMRWTSPSAPVIRA